MKEKVSLTYKAYLQKVLQKFNIGCEAKFVSSPLAPHFKLSADMSSKTVDERVYMSHVSYASIVCSLIYAIVYTEPDLSQAMSMVSRYMHDPSKNHWEAVGWILLYIKGTVDIRLVFEKDDHGKEFTDYVDFDYAGDFDMRRLTTF